MPVTMLSIMLLTEWAGSISSMSISRVSKLFPGGMRGTYNQLGSSTSSVSTVGYNNDHYLQISCSYGYKNLLEEVYLSSHKPHLYQGPLVCMDNDTYEYYLNEPMVTDA